MIAFEVSGDRIVLGYYWSFLCETPNGTDFNRVACLHKGTQASISSANELMTTGQVMQRDRQALQQSLAEEHKSIQKSSPRSTTHFHCSMRHIAIFRQTTVGQKHGHNQQQH